MRPAVPILLTLALLTPNMADAEPDDGRKGKTPLSIEELFADREREATPSQMKWTTDGRVSYFLDSKTDDKNDDKAESGEKDQGRDLWLMDTATGEKEILLDAEQLARLAPSADQAGQSEREKTRRSRFQVGAYHWSPDGKQILFSSSGRLLLQTLASGDIRPLAEDKKNVQDPKFSPDGQWIAFVYEHDIWVVSTADGKQKQVTFGGHDLLLHGDLDWVYPEELRVRTGYHWSPDSRRIAFMEMDQSGVPTYPIVEEVSWQPTVDLQRYPKVGDPNPRVRIGITQVEHPKMVWIDRAAEYIPRFQWADADHVAVQLLDRAQEELELILVAADKGRSKTLLFERDKHWINVTSDLTFLKDGRFLWTSESSGLRKIHLYGPDGTKIRTLAGGDFHIEGIEGIDEKEGWVYFTSNEANPIGRDLYRVKLDGSGKELLSPTRGSRRIQMNDEATAYIDSFSSFTDPGGRTLRHLATGKEIVISEARDSREDYDLVAPTMKVLKTDDGATIRVLLFEPEGAKAGDKRPVLVYVYGMAGFPTIRDSWPFSGTRNLFHQLMLQKGYVVAFIDDRSASIPGHKYAAQADHNVGPVAAEDHAVAVEYLKTLPYVDGDRMAIWGWSGGGFSTAYHLSHTKLFKVGVAGASPTDWRLYDSIYTERYMGLLPENVEAYERTSAINGAENVTGRLLLIHGTHDDNVHPQNTTKMVDALIKAGKQFDLMLYPNKTHGVSGKTHRKHMHQMILDYLERWL